MDINRFLQVNFAIATLLVTCAPEVFANNLEDKIRVYLQGKRAQAGVAVVVKGKVIAKVNDDTHFPLMSVYKLHQALYVADYLQETHKGLDSLIWITRKDLHPDTYSPLRDEHPEAGFKMSIADLLRYSLQKSDNNACDILFRQFGNPDRVNNHIRSLGFSRFAIKYTEKEMHHVPERSMGNWSSPSDAALLIEALYNDKRFCGKHFDFIRECLETCTTGTDRIADPFSDTNAIVAHKTGTGGKNANGKLTGINDVAYIRLPNKVEYALVVFIKESSYDMPATCRLIADISAICLTHLAEQSDGATRVSTAPYN